MSHGDDIEFVFSVEIVSKSRCCRRTYNVVPKESQRSGEVTGAAEGARSQLSKVLARVMKNIRGYVPRYCSHERSVSNMKYESMNLIIRVKIQFSIR